MPMRSKHPIAIAAMAFSSIVCAQMPVPLLDNEPAAPNAALWAVAGPMLQAALECREDLPDHRHRPWPCGGPLGGNTGFRLSTAKTSHDETQRHPTMKHKEIPR